MFWVIILSILAVGIPILISLFTIVSIIFQFWKVKKCPYCGGSKVCNFMSDDEYCLDCDRIIIEKQGHFFIR